MPLVKAVQEQQKKIAELQKEVSDQIRLNGELKVELVEKQKTTSARLVKLEELISKGNIL